MRSVAECFTTTRIMTTTLEVMQFFAGLGQSDTYEFYAALLLSVGHEEGSVVTLEHVLRMMEKRKRDHAAVLDSDEPDTLAAFVSLGGAVDGSGTVDAASLIRAIESLKSLSETKPLLGSETNGRAGNAGLNDGALRLARRDRQFQQLWRKDDSEDREGAAPSRLPRPRSFALGRHSSSFRRRDDVAAAAAAVAAEKSPTLGGGGGTAVTALEEPEFLVDYAAFTALFQRARGNVAASHLTGIAMGTPTDHDLEISGGLCGSAAQLRHRRPHATGAPGAVGRTSGLTSRTESTNNMLARSGSMSMRGPCDAMARATPMAPQTSLGACTSASVFETAAPNLGASGAAGGASTGSVTRPSPEAATASANTAEAEQWSGDEDDEDSEGGAWGPNGGGTAAGAAAATVRGVSARDLVGRIMEAHRGRLRARGDVSPLLQWTPSTHRLRILNPYRRPKPSAVSGRPPVMVERELRNEARLLLELREKIDDEIEQIRSAATNHTRQVVQHHRRRTSLAEGLPVSVVHRPMSAASSSVSVVTASHEGSSSRYANLRNERDNEFVLAVAAEARRQFGGRLAPAPRESIPPQLVPPRPVKKATIEGSRFPLGEATPFAAAATILPELEPLSTATEISMKLSFPRMAVAAPVPPVVQPTGE